MSVSARCSGRPQKPTRNRSLGSFALAEQAAAAGLPSVGIGGIDVSNAGAVIRAGVDGVAVISAIQGAPNVRAGRRVARARRQSGEDRALTALCSSNEVVDEARPQCVIPSPQARNLVIGDIDCDERRDSSCARNDTVTCQGRSSSSGNQRHAARSTRYGSRNGTPSSRSSPAMTSGWPQCQPPLKNPLRSTTR